MTPEDGEKIKLYQKIKLLQKKLLKNKLLSKQKKKTHPKQVTKEPQLFKLAEISIDATMEEMLNFNNFILGLQRKFFERGAVKVIPPPEWTGFVSYDEMIRNFKGQNVCPKSQYGWFESDGLYRLTNNNTKEKAVGVRLFILAILRAFFKYQK